MSLLPGSPALQMPPAQPVLFLCNKLHAGGAEKQLLLTVKALAELGIQSKVRSFASPEPAKSLKPLAAEIGTAHGIVPNRFRWQELLTIRQTPHTYWSWGRRADLVLKTLKPWLKGHLFCSLRDADIDKMRRYRQFERYAHARVDRYVSNSFRACDELSQIVPNVKDRSVILLNALYQVPAAIIPIHPGSRPFRVGMLGNILVHKKGYDIVLELAQLLLERQSNIGLVVAGRDESKGHFAQAIRNRNLGDVLHYLGPSDHPLEFLSGLDAFLLLSRYEAVPNALLEAMSIGLPCISTRVGDVPELFKDQHQVHILPAPSAELAYAAICRLRDNPDYASHLGRQGREVVLDRCSFARLRSNLASLFIPPELSSASSSQRPRSSEPAAAS